MAIRKIKEWVLSKRKLPDLKRNVDVGELKREDVEALIAEQAYSLFEQRGYQHGLDKNDWFEAERIVAKFLKKQTVGRGV